MAEGDTWVNSFVGAIISILLGAFVPLVPLLGGGVAGYLQGGARNDGMKVGLIAGVIAWIPYALLLAALATILSAVDVPLPIMGPEGAVLGYFGDGLGTLLLVAGAILSFLYFVILSAVGGWLGNYVKHDTDIDV